MSAADEGLEWRRVESPPGWEPGTSGSVDPYLLWAALFHFRNVPGGSGPGPSTLPFLIEFAVAIESDEVTPLLARVATEPGLGEPAREINASFTLFKSRYHTAHVPLQALPSLFYLQRHGHVLRFQLGTPRGTPARFSGVDFVASAFPSIATLGVIDDGCPFAHEAFRGDSTTAGVWYLWDQDPLASLARPWRRWRFRDGSFPRYGAELNSVEIEKLLAGAGTGTAAEQSVYRRADRPNWGQGGRTHGARVLWLLAAPRQRPPPPAGKPDARKMPIVFVQLPGDTVADTSGGSLGFYVLDGVRYIVKRTRDAVTVPSNWSTTINISLGSIAGPHDGSTIAERAIDEIVTHYPGQVQVVMAGGNTAGRRIHATRELSASCPARFLVMVPPCNERESYVEIWLPAKDGSGAVLDLRQLEVAVMPPEGPAVQAIRLGECHGLRTNGGDWIGMLSFQPLAPQSEDRTMVWLGLRPTDTRRTRGAATPAGVWTIEVRSRLHTPAQLHAWTERNDTIIGPRRSQQTHFVHDSESMAKGSYVTDDHTLSSIAHGAQTAVAGAYDHALRRVAAYSGRGPVIGSAAGKPDYFAPSDRSPTRPGVRVGGFYSGTHAALSGTSAAAPRVARWLAEGKPPAETLPVAPAQGQSAVAASRTGIVISSSFPDLEEESPR